jgi:exosortase
MWFLGLSALAWTVFSVTPWRVLWTVYRSDPNYSHGLLLPAVAGWVAWRVRAPLATAGEGARWPGFVLLSAGAGLTVFSHWIHMAFQLGWRGYVWLQGASWLTATAGWVGMILGWPRLRFLAPRLGFLVFMVPLPDAWLLTMMLALQRAVAVCSTGLLRTLGLVVCREGDVLHLPSVTLGVAGACSGIRSLMTFFATAAVCAVVFQLGTRRALLLLALAPVAAVATNILRVVATGLLADRWGRIWLEGAWHDALGLGAVLLGGLLLLAAAQALRPKAAAVPTRPRSGMAVWRATLRPATALGAVLILTGGALGLFHTTHHYARLARSMRPSNVARRSLADFPLRVGSYRMAGQFDLAEFERDMLRPADSLIRIYTDGEGRELRLTVLYWEPRPVDFGARAPAPVPHSPTLCWRYEGWELVCSDAPAVVDWLPGNWIETSQFEKAGRQRLVLYWRSHREGDPHAFAPGRLGQSLAALVRSWRTPPEAWTMPLYQIRIDISVENDVESAKAHVLDFARLISAILPSHGIGESVGKLNNRDLAGRHHLTRRRSMEFRF